MKNWRLFHFSSPVTVHAWHGDAAIAERLLSEWGWAIEQREPEDSEALTRFLAFAPEPGNDQDQEPALLSHWHDWHLLILYHRFGGLREVYRDYPVPIIEFTVPAGCHLAQLGDAPNFRLDLMLDQQHFYFSYVHDGAIWRDEMQAELNEKNDGQLILLGDEEWAVEWQLGECNYPGYGFQNYILLSSNLGQNLEQLGLPIQQWHNRSGDIVNEMLEIVYRTHFQSLSPWRRV